MEKKGFSCEVRLDVHLVSCPGTRHLSNRNMLFLRIALLGSSKRTKSVYASLPLIFNERLYFERMFVNAKEPQHAMGILEDENVIIELLQYSDRHEGGKLLAYYEESSRTFLFPERSLTKKNGMDREILLNRTTTFQGLNPKLEFSTNTTMQETTAIGGSYGTFYETQEDITSFDDNIQPGSLSCSESDGEINDIISTPIPRKSRKKHCVCECPRRPENHGRVVVKSRSLSPRIKRSSKMTSRKVNNRKPPFKTGKADESIISRRDFPPSPSLERRAKSRSSLPSTPMPAEGDPLPCKDCRVPHNDCLVCQAYYKVYGKEFLQYRFGPDRHVRSMSTPSLSFQKTSPALARARLPNSGPTVDDIAYSQPLTRNRKSVISNESDSYGSYRDSSDEMHERVKKLLEKTKIYSNNDTSDSENSETDSDKDSLFSLQDLRCEIDEARNEALNRSYEDPEHPTLGTRLNRSVSVPLDDMEWWSNKKSTYTGHSHRYIFEDSLQSIYHDLYNKASKTR